MEKKWTYTDDPNDPCIYCVQWRLPDGTDNFDIENIDTAEPYWPDGSVVPRVFDGTCERCEESIAQMHQDRQDDMTMGTH